MLEDPIEWRKLVHEYSDLQRLRDGMTAQARGQRFNGMIAGLFTAFGIAAKANQKSVGEIDVTFSHGGRRFILEAKWEQKKSGTGPIAKLQRRVEQRMVGVSGAFLSMGGFSPDALAEVDKGRRLDMVLLDRDHWEAMLSGFVPPPELLDLITDAASFHGQAYTPLKDLISQSTATPRLRISTKPRSDASIFRSTAEHVRADIVADDIETRNFGVAAYGRDLLLATTDLGVVSLELSSRKAGWAVPVSGCHGNPLPLNDSILVQRGHGVARYRDGAVTPLPSGASTSGRHQLVPHPANAVWLLDPNSGSALPTFIRVTPDNHLGDETGSFELPTGSTGAAWLSPTKALVTGGSRTIVLSGADTVELGEVVPNSHPSALAALGGGLVATLDQDSTLWVTDPKTERSAAIGRAASADPGTGCLAAGTDGSVYAGVRYRTGDGSSRFAIVRVSTAESWLRPPTPERPPVPHVPTHEPTGGPRSAPVGDPLRSTPSLERPTAVPELLTTPPQPVGGVSSTPPVIHMSRVSDQQQGHRDGLSLAATLPLFSLEGAVHAHFDTVLWLRPWRESWRAVVTGQEPAGGTVADWLPSAARYLGSYAAPLETVDSHFTPSAAYVAGFGHGMRDAWEAAVQRRAVPREPSVLHEWLRQPVDLRRPANDSVRGRMTLKDLRVDAIRNRGVAAWRWLGRIALWCATTFFGIGTLIAVILTATNGWPTQTAINSIGGLLFYSLPFAGLLWLTVRDVRRRRLRKSTGSS